MEPVIFVGVLGNSFIGPFAVNIRAGPDNDPETFFAGQFKKTLQIARLVGLTGKIKMPALVFVVIPGDISGDDLKPHLPDPLEDSFPIGRIEPPIMHFTAQKRNLFRDRKSTRLNSSHSSISYAVF